VKPRIAAHWIRDFQLPKDAIYVWGRKPSGQRLRRMALATGRQVISLEEGFLRSFRGGPKQSILSLCVDPSGIYYDSSQPSRLEELIQAELSIEEQRRANQLIHSWRQYRLSKFNGELESPAPQEPFVLVVDQTAGDLSIQWGQADTRSFQHMLECALRDWPNHRILVKQHPRAGKGGKRGHFISQRIQQSRLRFCMDGGHPCDLLEQCSAVYVVTSQMGFEGLLWGKPVYTFGMPFYAGWGLTQDHHQRPERRRRHISLQQLAHAALVRYPLYRHPESGHRTDPETVMQWLGQQRQHLLQYPNHLEAFGFTPWKARQLRAFLPRATHQTLRFRRRHAVPHSQTDLAFTWGMKPCNGVDQSNISRVRVEDGLIRSAGLGANLIEAQSWVFDQQGIYYNAEQASGLETLISTLQLTDAQRGRAKAARNTLIQHNISKYNLGGTPWAAADGVEQRFKVLVLGQVDQDASIRHGVPPDAAVQTSSQLLTEVRQQFPQAWVIYKPHPDLVAGLRGSAKLPKQITHHCDEVVLDACLATLFEQVDRVCVLTSLGGFEALVRGLPVHTWGLPFYAGWGLTQDALSNHLWIRERRRHQVDLETLIYASLIAYPTYRSPNGNGICSVEDTMRSIQKLRANPAQRLNLEQQIFRWWGALASRVQQRRQRPREEQR